MTDREKIEAIINDKHLNNTQFSNEVCISPGTLSNIRSGKTEPSLNILRSILAAFPDINPSWLFYDQGTMYVGEKSSTTPEADAYNNMSDDESTPVSAAQGDLFSASFDFSSQIPNAAHSHTSGSASMNNVPAGQRKSVQPQSLSAVEVSAVVAETLKQQQKPQRKVVEVRIFFDDGTFETFNAN